jgi:hypothetical protein
MSSDNSEALPEGHVSVNATVFVHDSSQPWAQAFPLSTTVAAVLDEIVAKFSIPEPATCGLYSPATDSEPECWLTTSETLATYKTVCVWLELRCNRWLSVSADLLLAVCLCAFIATRLVGVQTPALESENHTTKQNRGFHCPGSECYMSHSVLGIYSSLPTVHKPGSLFLLACC